MEDPGKSLSYYQSGMIPQEEIIDREKKGKQTLIGLLRESDSHETRIALTPQGVDLLVSQGHRVLMERGAGEGARFSDHDYAEAGAEIQENKSRIFEAEVLLKISPLTGDEIRNLRPGKTVISSLQLATRKETYFRELIRHKVTAIAFELVRDELMEFPVFRSMCEISGLLAVNIGASLMSREKIGKGILLGGITGITPAEVVILGAGVAGEYAARAALGMGATVKVFDHSITALRALKHQVGREIFTSVLHPPVLEKTLKSADLVISTLQRLHQESFFLVPEEMVVGMKEGAIVIDRHVDQGSSFETGVLSSAADPVYIRHQVIHYMVPNLPTLAPRTASIALSNFFLPMLLNQGRSGGIQQMIRDNWGVRQGVYLYNGVLTHAMIGDQFGMPSKDIDLLLAAF
ncbi:MAG: alanine dehydrogenase [Bacteroidales bacterium]|nr:alanine dehydrogenase [Bacteroidales bacterium]